LPELRLTRRARRDLLELPRPLQQAAAETISRIALDPDAEGKELLGGLRGLWSARVGSYRVLYTIEARTVVVRAILHRAVAYQRRRGR
jgi:mRNA interferase RelE/StbE